jgi:hypothetical protein
MAQARELLGLKKHTLSREVREGRLRVSRRAGRNYLLGTWLWQWLVEGEIKRRRHSPVPGPSGNGHAEEN